MSSATSDREKGRVIGVLGATKQLLDALCDSVAPCTGSDVLRDQEFEQLMAMSDKLDRLIGTLSTRP